jgi:hypothetical protein
MEAQRIIFPLNYWDLIRRYAGQNGIDPYLLAALVAQESTFVPDIKSGANAVGLMQLIPATARQYARRLKVSYSTRALVSPEANIRLGTAYFGDKVREFGGLHLALASYNAGERPVRKWMAEKPGIDRDEFIDDIPYPETQMYVKKILGTAEDYRRIYGGTDGAATFDGEVAARPVSAVKKAVASTKKPPVAVRASATRRGHATTAPKKAARHPARKPSARTKRAAARTRKSA